MTLDELLIRHAWRPLDGVPDWMVGYFKRYSISFADGQTDTRTHVCWLQSRHFTIDLRLPVRHDQPHRSQGRALTDNRLSDIQPDTWLRWADFEGWKAPASWDGSRLTWLPPDASLQWHDRWPEAAILKRVGHSMIEFCDSDAYVEDWRLQPSRPGPLVGLHLLYEQDQRSGNITHVGGGWIICGDHAALVLGHPPRASRARSHAVLRDQVAALLTRQESATVPPESLAHLASLFRFEASVASWSGRSHEVLWSTRPDRVGASLCPTDGLRWVSDAPSRTEPVEVPRHLAHLPRVTQTLTVKGSIRVRYFAVDTLEPELPYNLETPCSETGRAWLQREARTLRRYTDLLGDAHVDPVTS